jgi:hypothetical protein
VTTDLLSVWTDPDTAMHAVGSSLGIFDHEVSSANVVLPGESPLRDALYDVLLYLVNDGALEQRACADGRYAFRWRDDNASAAVTTDAASTRLDAYLASLPVADDFILSTPRREQRRRSWRRLAATTAPLLLPATSCALAILAFVLFGRSVAIGVAVALLLIGVVGLVRRVPLAGFWMVGVVTAALVLRLS